MDAKTVIETVQETYGAAARRVVSGATTSCCGPTCCGHENDPITSNLYTADQTGELPDTAVLASLGCGNPTMLAELRAGETVLDLGSGGGIDVLLSAKRVGPTGKAYGLDMTDDMLSLARQNAARAGATNVEFLKGQIEAVPLPDRSVDVIIYNCVVNLSADKRRVIAEAFRVLKPGGRFAVSDVVIRGDLPDAVRASMPLWTGCVGGALDEREFARLLTEAGFVDVSIEPTRVYELDDLRAILAGAGLEADRAAREITGRLVSAFVRATKPASSNA